MIYSSTLITFGAIGVVIGAGVGFLNILSAREGRRSLSSIFFYLLAASFWISGGGSLLIGIIMILIDYSKR